MNDFTIRKATDGDIPFMLGIYSYYVEKTAVSFEYETPSAEEFRRRIEMFSAGYPCFIAEKNGVVIGYAYAHEFIARRAYDYSAELTIYIDREYRRCGAGKMLYASLEDALGKMGITNIYACIGVPDEDDEYLNHNSIDFHIHLGFEQVGVFHKCGYKFGRWYNMVWAEKIIGDHIENKPPLINVSRIE